MFTNLALQDFPQTTENKDKNNCEEAWIITVQSSVSSLPTQTGRIGEISVSLGKISDNQLGEALNQQRQTGQRLGDILRERGLMSERDIAEAMAAQLGVPFCDLAVTTVDSSAVVLIPASIALTYAILPLRATIDRLQAVMLNPADREAIEIVTRLTGLTVEPMLGEPEAVRRVLNERYSGFANTPAVANEDNTLDTLIRRAAKSEQPALTEQQVPLAVIVEGLLKEGLAAGATDIHIDPFAEGMVVRHRINGSLRRARELPKTLQTPVLTEIKRLANLDPVERRHPQDGRITLSLAEGQRDLRVSLLPNLHGERVTFCVLRPRSAPFSNIGFSGMAPVNQERFTALLSRGCGLVLIAGPDDEERTNLLYSVLEGEEEAFGSTESHNILTCESPIARELLGVSQSAVDNEAGLTYSRQLRAILHQNPDAVVLGDLRDVETAEVAARAALEGPLLLASLRADDAIGAIVRLAEMGVSTHLIAAALTGVVVTRPYRRFCLACRTPGKLTEREAVLLCLERETPVYAPVGCLDCNDTGYKGFGLLHEVLICDDAFTRGLRANVPLSELRGLAAKGGMMTLREVVAQRVQAGLTSPMEALANSVGG